MFISTTRNSFDSFVVGIHTQSEIKNLQSILVSFFFKNQVWNGDQRFCIAWKT